MNSRYLKDTENFFYLMAERLSSALMSAIIKGSSRPKALINLAPKKAPESADTANVLKDKELHKSPFKPIK
jgi:hypothetical protein